jgi:hypothetical protein
MLFRPQATGSIVGSIARTGGRVGAAPVALWPEVSVEASSLFKGPELGEVLRFFFKKCDAHPGLPKWEKWDGRTDQGHLFENKEDYQRTCRSGPGWAFWEGAE